MVGLAPGCAVDCNGRLRFDESTSYNGSLRTNCRDLLVSRRSFRHLHWVDGPNRFATVGDFARGPAHLVRALCDRQSYDHRVFRDNFLSGFSCHRDYPLRVSAIRDRKEIQGEGWLILGGILDIAFGVILLFAPFAAGLFFVRIFGAFAIVAGVSMIVAAFQVRKTGKEIKSLFQSR